MSFDLSGKVALITGAGNGIGLCFARNLLENGLKGVTIAEKHQASGQKAAEELCKEFGPKVIFVQTDVTDKQQFVNAFERTFSTFHSLDIVINNAGIANETLWELEMEINFCGMVRGCLLAMEEFLPKYKSGGEGVVVNVASITGLDPLSSIPVYSATKFGIVGLGRGLGHEEIYKKFGVKVLTVCPGVTVTSLLTNVDVRYSDIKKTDLAVLPTQTVEYLGSTITDIVKKGKTGSVWVVENSEPPYELAFPTREDMKQ